MPMPQDVQGRFSTQIDAADLAAQMDRSDYLSYTAVMPDGSHIRGYTDSNGLTGRMNSKEAGILRMLLGDDDWAVHIDTDEPIGN